MPRGDNLFGQQGGEAPTGEAHSTGHVVGSPDKVAGSRSPDVHTSAKEGIVGEEILFPDGEGIESKLTSYSESSEESRYIPDIDEEDPDEDAISLVLLEEVVHQLEYNATAETELSAGQIEALTNFSTLCSTKGIEILKQNRRGAWQTRFLTVSEEMLQLQHSGSFARYPMALLWVKRFNPTQTYSLDSISSEGRGGVEFANIESVIVEESENNPPRNNGKFRESTLLSLHYTCGEKTRTLALRFKSKRDADYFASSIETIVDVLDHEGIY